MVGPCHPEERSLCHPEERFLCHPEERSLCHPEEGRSPDVRISKTTLSTTKYTKQ